MTHDFFLVLAEHGVEIRAVSFVHDAIVYTRDHAEKWNGSIERKVPSRGRWTLRKLIFVGERFLTDYLRRNSPQWCHDRPEKFFSRFRVVMLQIMFILGLLGFAAFRSPFLQVCVFFEKKKNGLKPV